MEYIGNTQLCGAEILKIFVENGLHTVGNMRVNWSKHVVCVCIVTFLNWTNALFIGQSTGSHHAEYGVINYLRINILRIRSVKIFCNFSPCSKPGHECCNLIGKIKEDLETQQRSRGDTDGVRSLTFIFSQLYDIARPSCRNRGCFEWGPNRHRRPQENAKSLNNLRSLGHGIRSFEMDDWKVLIELLALWDTCRCGVPTGIQISFLTSFFFGECGYWRCVEDANLKKDFHTFMQSNSYTQNQTNLLGAPLIITDHPVFNTGLSLSIPVCNMLGPCLSVVGPA